MASVLALAAALPPPVAAAANRSYVEHGVPPGSSPLPFSDAVLSGDALYVAGRIGVDSHTGEAPTDPASEARYPARAFIGAGKLPRGGHFEVQGVAVKGRA